MASDYGDHSVSNDHERTTPMHDETKPNHSADEVALRALYQQLMDGWNQGSGAAFAAGYVRPSATDGPRAAGRRPQG